MSFRASTQKNKNNNNNDDDDDDNDDNVEDDTWSWLNQVQLSVTSLTREIYNSC